MGGETSAAVAAEEEPPQKRRKKHRRRHSHRSHGCGHSDSSASISPDQETKEGARKGRKGKRSRRHERRKDGKRGGKGRREEKKEKRRKRKRHRSDSGSEGEARRRKRRRLVKEARGLLEKHKSGDDGSTRNMENKDLSGEDYFEKNKEFSAWLKEERGMYFSNLSSEETRALFQEFVNAWNLRKLPNKYYEGIENAPRTSHNWKIKDEKMLTLDREEEEEFKRKLLKSQRKKIHKENEELLDELAPKASGRERLLEKKIIRREQARAREDSPELLKDGDMMGGGDDFKKRLARDKARREKAAADRAEALDKKRSTVEKKEAAAMSHLRALIDMAGGKITIPKRNDPSG